MRTTLKLIISFCFAILFATTVAHAQGAKEKTKGENVIYTSDGITLKGYVAYNTAKEGKRPAIIVVPEWWGNTEYTHRRVRMLAELGYIAIAVDMYGDGKIAADPKQAMEYAGPFYKNPQMGTARILAAVKKIKEFPQTDENNIAAIGYCFGGSMVLNAAKMGTDFKGVVSFHGGLSGGIPATKGKVKAKILVCHGGEDKFSSESDIEHFKNNLDSAGVTYQFIVYPGATHAFTNPDATATGKKFNMPIRYDAAADQQSWKDMKAFFKTIF